MEFAIKRNNKIEYQTRKKLLKGQFIVRGINIGITSNDPLQMHKKLIEKAIVNELNKKIYN